MNTVEQTAAYLTLLERDKRFKLASYEFINEVAERAAMSGIGEFKETESEEDDETEPDVGVHVTGQQMCRVAVVHAVEQYGLMARITLDNLGFHTTEDIGDAVYNMIDVGLMAKTCDDSREDFDGVFDLGSELDAEFQFAYRGRRRK